MEPTELGHQLYWLLAKFDGYVARMVGRDLESLLDSAELKNELSAELAEGSIHGFVLCDRPHDEKSGSLTADESP